MRVSAAKRGLQYILSANVLVVTETETLLSLLTSIRGGFPSLSNVMSGLCLSWRHCGCRVARKSLALFLNELFGTLHVAFVKNSFKAHHSMIKRAVLIFARFVIYKKKESATQLGFCKHD